MPEKKVSDKVYQFLIYLSWLFILAVAIGDLFFVPTRSIVWFGSLFILILVYRNFKYLPKKVHLLLVFIALANIFGEVFYKFFYYFQNYDKVLHFINPIMIAIFTYYSVKDKIKNKSILVVYCVSVAFSLTLLWELFEYGLDYMFNTYLQGVFTFTKSDVFGIVARQTVDKLTDTMLDLISGIAGLMIFIAGFLFNELKFKKAKKKH